jgi:hypothetical protein
MSFAAKSVVIDIADNWGHASYIGLRSVDLYLNGALVETESTCYHTSVYSASYSAEHVFDTSKSKIGSWDSTSWVSGNGNTTNQRLVAVFDSEIEFDAIVVNNQHNSGAASDCGAKNIVITITEDTYTTTTYGASVTNGTDIFDGQLGQHVAVNEADGEIVLDQTGVWAKSVVFDCADNWGDASYMGIRAIELTADSSVISLASADFNAYSTTSSNAHFVADFAFETALSKTGSYSRTSWVSLSGNVTNQRLTIRFCNPLWFDGITVNNGHDSGSDTDIGAKAVKIYRTAESTTSTTYEDAVSGGTKIFDGQLLQHSAADEADDQELTLDDGSVDITSDGITTGSPAMGTPTMGQVHALTGAGIAAGAPDVDAPSIGQIHALTGSGITAGSPTLGAPDVIKDDLTASGIVTGIPSVGAPTTGQVHGITATGITTGSARVGTPAIDWTQPGTPESRTWRIPAEGREWKILFETRTWRIS